MLRCACSTPPALSIGPIVPPFRPLNQTNQIITSHSQADEAIARYCFSSGTAFNQFNTKAFRDMADALRRTSPAYRFPDRKKIAGPLLDRAFERADSKTEEELAAAAEGGGATFVTDGLTHASRPFTNMLVVGSFGVRSLGVIDSTEHMSDAGAKDAVYLAEQIDKCLARLPRRSITLIVTDGAAVMEAVKDLLRISHPDVAAALCLSHVLNNAFKKMGLIDVIKALIAKAQKVATAFKNREVPRATLQGTTAEHLGRALGTVIGSDVRFGTHFLVLHRLLRLKDALKAAVAKHAMVELARSEAAVGEVAAIINDDVFWRDVKVVVAFLWPGMMLLRLLDSDKPAMGVAVHAWRRLRFKLGQERGQLRWGSAGLEEGTITDEHIKQMEACVDDRSTAFGPIHYAAFMTNPALWAVSTTSDIAGMDGFKEFSKLVFLGRPNCAELADKALDQLLAYKRRAGAFGEAQALAAAEKAGLIAGDVRPADWWEKYGYHAPELKMVAMRALGQVVSVGAAERGHKVHKFLQPKLRSRLAPETLTKLITAHVDIRLAEKEAAEVEEEDEGLVNILRAVDEWWAQEVDMGRVQGTVEDWGVDGSEEMQDKKIFEAKRENWEVEKMDKKVDNAKDAFKRKYVGMMLRIQVEEDEAGEDQSKEEVRQVVGIEWDNTFRQRGWRVLARKVGGGEEDVVKMKIDDHLIQCIIEGADLNPDYVIHIPY